MQRLKQAGALLIGSTNMHEFAWGGTTNNPHYGASSNPWDDARILPVSSGGSGVASVRSALATLGTDTGGSIRLPASMNGITGLRPGVGRLSTEGIFPLATSLDTVGPLAPMPKSVKCCFNVLDGKTTAADSITGTGRIAYWLTAGCASAEYSLMSRLPMIQMVQWFSAAGACCQTLSLTGLEQAVNALVLINLGTGFTHAAWLADRPARIRCGCA
ncbi:amidase (plasmid) [Pseudomonas silvicola]|nr:amidase [Pseudomonas silvicola]